MVWGELFITVLCFLCALPQIQRVGLNLFKLRMSLFLREKYDLETFREVGGKIYIYNSLIDMVIIRFGWNTKHFNNSASFYYMK